MRIFDSTITPSIRFEYKRFANKNDCAACSKSEPVKRKLVFPNTVSSHTIDIF